MTLSLFRATAWLALGALLTWCQAPFGRNFIKVSRFWCLAPFATVSDTALRSAQASGTNVGLEELPEALGHQPESSVAAIPAASAGAGEQAARGEAPQPSPEPFGELRVPSDVEGRPEGIEGAGMEEMTRRQFLEKIAKGVAMVAAQTRGLLGGLDVASPIEVAAAAVSAGPAVREPYLLVIQELVRRKTHYPSVSHFAGSVGDTILYTNRRIAHGWSLVGRTWGRLSFADQASQLQARLDQLSSEVQEASTRSFRAFEELARQVQGNEPLLELRAQWMAMAKGPPRVPQMPDGVTEAGREYYESFLGKEAAFRQQVQAMLDELTDDELRQGLQAAIGKGQEWVRESLTKGIQRLKVYSQTINRLAEEEAVREERARQLWEQLSRVHVWKREAPAEAPIWPMVHGLSAAPVVYLLDPPAMALAPLLHHLGLPFVVLVGEAWQAERLVSGVGLPEAMWSAYVAQHIVIVRSRSLSGAREEARRKLAAQGFEMMEERIVSVLTDPIVQQIEALLRLNRLELASDDAKAAAGAAVTLAQQL